METGSLVSMRPTKGYASTKSPTKGYTSTKSPDRHSRSTNLPSTPRSRRTPAPPSNRDPYGNNSHSSSSNSGSYKGSDCSPTKGRHQKYPSCTDNHGIRPPPPEQYLTPLQQKEVCIRIRPPPPEQYLTPLQQKEVCIRHLRARLKETISTLHVRDTEIDELRVQLYRMQEDWVEEECHRVEAQLALKEARQEIQQLKNAVDIVRNRLSDAGGLSGDAGVQKYFQDINTQNHKLENLLLSMELAQTGLAREGEGIPGFRTRVGGSAPASVSGESPGGVPKPAVGGRGSCSCDGSPARSLTRSSTYTKLSDQALADRNGNGPDFPCLSGAGTQDSGFVCCGESSIPSRADLLLEAAFLSEETTSLLNSYSQTFPHSLPNSLPHSFSQTLPHSFSQPLPHTLPHNFSHTLPHTIPHSSTYEKLCTGDRLAPFRCALGGGVACMSHPCLSHHHLYLHPLRETGIQTESCPIPTTAGYPSDLDTIAEQRTFRSQACSPTSTWMSDEAEEELDSITTLTLVTTATMMTAATEPLPVSKTPVVAPLPRSATVTCSMEIPLCKEKDGEEEEKQEKEHREKLIAAIEEQEETKLVGLVEEGQQAQMDTVGCDQVESQDAVEEAAQWNQCDLVDTTAGMQGELRMGGCTDEEEGQGDTQLEDLSGKEKHKEVGQLVISTQVTAELSPNCQGSSAGVEQPQTSQPRRSTSPEELASLNVVEADDDNDDEETKEQGSAAAEEGNSSSTSSSGSVQKSYWSRHFLIDLLAVAIPVVPTVAWLCRGPVRNGQPMYHIGSLLRGCCTVALHSLRRGGGLRHYPAGGGDLGGSQI
ncbi:hypothetical protein LDENG_00050990 [Lucifuga dentata]|nr:hypothetical protein LDENG_00050990 [Lucifuga dentata]